MPRLFNRPPQYRRHSARNEAIVTFAGKHHYLGKYDSPESRARYEEIVSLWRSSLLTAPKPNSLSPIIVPASELSLRNRAKAGGAVFVVEVAFCYTEHARDYYRKNGRVTREAETIHEVCKTLGERYPSLRVQDFGPVCLDEFRQHLILEKDWSRKYINKQVSRLLRMMKWGVSREIVPPAIHLALAALPGLRHGRTQARETRRIPPVADTVVDATLPYLSTIVADMVRLQRLSGARPGEVCGLRSCDVTRLSEVWKYTPSEHKTEHMDRDRVIFFGPRAQAILAKYMADGSTDYCFSPKSSVSEMRHKRQFARKNPLSRGNCVGTNRVENPQSAPSDRYTTASYRRAIHRACGLAFPVPPHLKGKQRSEWRTAHQWHPNQLRHTAATEVRKDFGLEGSQVMLGHSSANVTQIYAERDHTLAARIAMKVG